MRERYGEVFPLGGLAGLPFTGKTGWGAFSHHVPENGNIMVLYAPHVGISSDGKVGTVHRHGQEETTSACGASIGAYNSLAPSDAAAGRHLEDAETRDRQMEYIIDALRPHVEKLSGAGEHNDVMAALAFETYNMVEEMLYETIDRRWMSPHSKLVLLGGIMLNVDGDAPDQFVPLRFESLDKDGNVNDLMQMSFGKTSAQFAVLNIPVRCEPGFALNEESNNCEMCALTSDCSLTSDEQKKSLAKHFPAAINSSEVD